MFVRHLTIRMAVSGLLVAAAALALAFRAGAQDCRQGDFGCGHAASHDSYKNWHSPYDGGSCCKDADCRPTRARQLEDGSWEAWVQGAWRRVPKRAMLELSHDRFAAMKVEYEKAGPEPSNMRYGYVVPNGPVDYSVFA